MPTVLSSLLKTAAVSLILLQPAPAQNALDSLGITVRGESREFSFTNKQSAFYYGETHARNRSSWQGFNVAGFEVVDDYALLLDGNPLTRAAAESVVVYPDRLERLYPQGVAEQVFVTDDLPVLVVVVAADRPVELAIIPLFTDGRAEEDYLLEIADSIALLYRKHQGGGRGKTGAGPWLAVAGSRSVPMREVTSRGNQFSPLLLSSQRAREHVFCLAVGKSRKEAAMLARTVSERFKPLAGIRRARMQRLLDRTHTETGDASYDRALAWAKLSLDALVMNHPTRGIYAGLPWFNNYWGRDTFISLPGAALVTGDYGLAREILVSFAAFQQKDSNSSDYGRIPNIINGTDVVYNTADGTPRFVAMTRDYIQRSGDTSFARDIYPVVLRSIEGTRRFHTDSLGFLIHGDAETWMDAVGPEGPWSPRGNRANDIQAMWEEQLAAGIWLATLVGDRPSARTWQDWKEKVAENFRRFFIRGGLVIDHLDTDGAADSQVRPNQIFTTHLLDPKTRLDLVRRVTAELTYPHGVASLSQEDDQFHAYHQFAPFYPKDAAYHNGIVWTWLQGRLISELVLLGQTPLAYRLTQNATRQILTRGAAGTQSELLDAAPRPGEEVPRLSGTFSQAWNLAEYIRTFYDDYLGIRPNLAEQKLVLRPSLPASVNPAEATVRLGDQSIQILIDQSLSSPRVEIDAEHLDTPLKTSVALPSWEGQELIFDLPAHSNAKVLVENNVVTLYVNGTKQLSTLGTPQHYVSDEDPLEFLSPVVRPYLPSLRGPEYPLLSHATIKTEPDKKKRLLDVEDPLGDDKGVGACSDTFSYPRSTQFVRGSFDLTRLQIDRDSSNLYFRLHFRSLSDPGWHPEYGFQLTFAAIAIDTDGLTGSGSLQVGHNSGYSLPPQSAYERLVLIGGGIQVEDQQGRILAGYVPTEADMSKTLGTAVEGLISFALPLALIGEPTAGWHFTLLSGGQDDHGGAGLGEFRLVQEEPSEWHGGGRKSPSDPNVFDDLVAVPHE
ncbi:MAG: amylo-alpha-1,6-glucosidase [Bacteroidota bacterium]